MTLPFEQYLKVKNNYCFCYFGNSNEFIILLKMLRPYMEAKYKGVSIYIACKDESYYLLQDEPRCIRKSNFKKENYCYVRNIMNDFKQHPIHELLIESDIKPPILSQPSKEITSKIYIYTNGDIPTKSLSSQYVEKLVKNLESKGKNCFVNENHDEYSSVYSVENETLLNCALKNINCTLIDSGLGTALYKAIFPQINVISMNW